MQAFRKAVSAIAGSLAAAVSSIAPAWAQTAGATTTTDQGQGPSLLWVWVWILVVGIIIFVAGTSFGIGNRGRRR